jgi:hypothetical protein
MVDAVPHEKQGLLSYARFISVEPTEKQFFPVYMDPLTATGHISWLAYGRFKLST